MGFNKFKEKFSKRREKDDTGAGLVSLIGVSMIVVITASAVTSSATFSTNRVSSSLSQQQAKDYAKAGLDSVELVIEDASINSSANHPSSFSKSIGDGEYTVNISHSDATYIQRPDNALSRAASTEKEKERYKKWRAENKIQDGWPSAADRWIIVEPIGKGFHDKISSTIAIYEWRDADVAVSPYALAAKNVLLNGSEVDTSSGVTGKASVISTDGYLRCYASGPSMIKGDIKKSTPGSSSYLDGCTVDGNVYSKYYIKAKDNTITGKFFSNISNQTYQRDNLNPESKLVDARGTELDSWTPSLYGYSPILTETDSPSPGKPKVKKLAQNQCTNKTLFASLVQGLDDANKTPVILDGTECTSFTALYGSSTAKIDLKLNTDVSLVLDVAPYINYANISSGDGNHHSFTVAMRSGEESTNSITPNPKGAGSVRVDDSNTLPGISMMIYSSDQILIQRSNITGQAMAGATINFAKSKLNYHPVTLLGTTKVVSPKNGAPGLVRVY